MFGMRKMLKQNGPGKVLILMITCFTFVFTTFMPVAATAATVETAIKHNPPDYFVPKHRIQLDVAVKDPAGTKLVRCYFKGSGQADFVFVPATQTGGGSDGAFFSARLPAPSTATAKIEYLFLTVNNNNQIVKTQPFTIERDLSEDTPAWQYAPDKSEIQVSMELDKVPHELPGFTDNIVMNKVESGLRFGVVAGGLYYLTKDKKSHTSGQAASSTSAGTVTATTAGFSTAFLVGAGVLGAAALGGAAAAIGGGGGGSSSGGKELTEDTIVGTWSVTGSHPAGSTTSGKITYNENGSFSYNLSTLHLGDTSPSTEAGGGNWSLSGTYLTMNFDAGAIYEGYASGDSKSFVLDSTNNGWTLNFKR